MLSFGALLAAVAAIVADVGHRRPLFYLAKPLATVLILLPLVLLPATAPYARWTLFAGIGCLLGDVLLMGRGTTFFAAGLVSFLVAHLLFVAAFRADGPFDPPTWSLAVATTGIVAAGALARRAGRLHVAVALYAAALLAMFVCAAARATAFGDAATRHALIGAGLFTISDGVLGFRRFVRPFAGGQALTLSTYYLALWLIVQSIPGIHP